MNQAETLRTWDSEIMQAFRDAGMADQGVYVFGGDEVPVTVTVDLDVAVAGDLGGIVGYRSEVGFQLIEVSPRKGAQLTITGSPDIVLRLDAKLSEDESRSVWQCSRVKL